LERFLAELRGADPRGRCEAITAFSYAGNFAAIPYVSAVLLRLDETLSVRVAAARALGSIGDRRARGFLARAVMDREPQVRLASAIALGRVADRGGAKPLSRALRSETDDNVRAALAWALGTVKGRGN
jgi:HEAT repeat protein